MGGFSLIHWLILGVVVLLLFGGNRFSSMMGDVAKGLKSFKQGMTDDDKPVVPPAQQLPYSQSQSQQGAPPIELTPQPPHPDPVAVPRADPAVPPHSDQVR